tara:strand:- start:18665 stop:22267 length:3603 start_codon:yes stop_codon:yes gene_type:complete
MGTDQTLAVDANSIAAAVNPTPLSVISVGQDGETLVGKESDGRLYELKVLTVAGKDKQRVERIRQQLSRLELIQHDGIRDLYTPLSTGVAPAFKLNLPNTIDPVKHRLSNQLDGLDGQNRLSIAAQLVDATVAAHRVGLLHGSFAPSTILVDTHSATPKVFVDFSSTSCSDDIQVTELSIENDLHTLQSLFVRLLQPLVESDTDFGDGEWLGGRQRVLLRQWLKESTELPPSLRQWQMVLEPFALKAHTNDHTGVISPHPIQLCTGSTSHFDGDVVAKTFDRRATPEQLGRFRLIEKIGEGGMGAVFRATDLADGELVAVKLLRNNGGDIAQSIRRFRKEAILLADAQNDYVTKLIEVGEDKGFHFLAMEFVDGIDLKRWLSKRGPLNETVALKISADLARALVDAHSREVIHRDIKPENVLLKLRTDIPSSNIPIEDHPIDDFTIKLTDFGIARHVNQSQSMEVTQAGALLGTPKYMSPEQCKSNVAIGPAADVYAVGITMYALLTGGVPFDSDDFVRLAAMHCFDAPPSIQKRNAAISDQTVRLVEKSLAKSPADRFGDATQLLTEILKIMRGEAVEMQAHPKPPEHQTGKLWEKTVSWQMDSLPAQLWPYVSNTERLNEALGLPAVDYRTEKDPIRGIRKFGSFVLGGVKVAWEEHPFEWVEGRRMGILREFESGPFKWFMSVVTLEPAIGGGGTQLSHQVRIEPRNMLGRVLTTIEADWKGFRSLKRVYERIDRSIQGRLKLSDGSDPFTHAKPLSRSQLARIQTRIDAIIESGVEPDVAKGVQTALQTWAPQELSHLQPLVMADRLGIDGAAMIDACLVAATKGLLNLNWNVLCPTCRVSALSTDKLSSIQAHTHCEACDVDFKSNLGNVIEMTFRVHPEIRDVNDGQYCIGGPEHAPHVVAQVRVEKEECLELSLDLGPGDYLLRGPRIPRTQSIRVQDSSAPSSIEFNLSALGRGHHTPKLRSGRQKLTLVNDEASLHVIRIERMVQRDDAVTATMASANPVFRKLFPHENFAGNNPIETEMMTFLATCINNVNDLYVLMEDSEAYTLILDHHKLLAAAIVSSGGSVVKTIGERMLATFNQREFAVEAMLRIRETLKDLEAQTLQLGIGIHCGPTLVATQNDQLDYFGSTVRAVSSLPVFAGQSTLVTEDVYTDPGVNELHPIFGDAIEIIDLPGNPHLRVKRIEGTVEFHDE